MKQPLPGEGLSTDELFDQAYAQLRALKNHARTRRRRERALELCTDLWMSVQDIARRVGELVFVERPVALEDEEDEGAAPEDRISMHELLPLDAEAGEGFHDEATAADLEALRGRIKELEKSRLEYFQIFLAYLTKGCRQEGEVTRRLLALVRRVSPRLLKDFGLSQADVARKLGEVRATVSARERLHVKKPLQEAGARGVLGNGARSEETSQRCAKAQRGNKNRAGGKGRKSRRKRKL